MSTEVITAIAVSIGAAATIFFGFWNIVHLRRHDLPVVSAAAHLSLVEGLPPFIDFKMEAHGAAKWRVTGVRTRGTGRRQWLAEPADSVHDEYGGIQGYRPGPWHARIKYETPTNIGTLALHPDAPNSFWLLFEVRFRANPKVRRRVPVEIVLP